MTQSTHSRASLSAPTILALAFVAGSLPFSNVASKLLAGVDLRDVGTGTVSGTGLYGVAGFPALAVAGTLDLAKGAFGAALAGPARPGLRALAAAMTLAGHNWSPWLRGAGGRGLAPALGATLTFAPEATAVLGLGMTGGRLLRHTAAGCFWSMLALFPVLAVTRGRAGLRDAAAIAAPMVGKRLLGNQPPARPGLAVYINRLVLDRDERPPRSAGRALLGGRAAGVAAPSGL